MSFGYKRYPDAPCMEYLPTFTINLSQMQVNIPYIRRIWDMYNSPGLKIYN